MTVPLSHFERMMLLIDETFATRSDPDQLQVDESVIEKLQEIHPATLSEYNEGSGPGIWVLLIPTTKTVMNDFLSGRISEQELLYRTSPGEQYEAVYLCSATCLPEYRRRGLSRKLCLDAIDKLCKDYPIDALYVWPFTKEGEVLARKIVESTGISLHIVPHKS